MSLVDEFLEHHGVKGQKWGVRRARTKTTPSADHTQATAHKKTVKKHGTKALSNDELSVLVKRLELETKYSSLQSKQKSPSRKIADDLVASYFKAQAREAVNDVGAILIKSVLNKA